MDDGLLDLELQRPRGDERWGGKEMPLAWWLVFGNEANLLEAKWVLIDALTGEVLYNEFEK